MTTQINPTGRYSVGQVIYAMAYIYSEFDKSSIVAPLLWDTSAPNAVKFIELTVTEHHKVSDEYDVEKKLDCDGYILKCADGNSYTNQYPYASFEQLSDKGNRIFTIEYRGLSELDLKTLFDNKVNNPTRWISITDHIDAIKRGVESEEFKNSSPDIHAQLTNVFKMINETFEKQFPGKMLKVQPKPIEFKDGTVSYYPDIQEAIVVDKE